jgi:Tannase and feruloyl esterase
MRVPVYYLCGALALTGAGISAPGYAKSGPALLTPEKCAALIGTAIPVGSIGLPTTGAIIDAAGMAEAADKTVQGKYCLVAGKIHPVDKSAPDIQFHIALPQKWNGKAAMLGGAGYDGVIQDVSGNLPNALPSTPGPLARGYAVFASDGGNQFDSASGKAAGAFLVNEEAHHNWMGDALKKTRDTSMLVIKAAYRRTPTRSYFMGGSTGGREALTVAGRWPKDWDGIVSLYPARNVTASILGMLATTQKLAEPGAFVSTAKRTVLYRAVMQSCDGLDGVADGLISNVNACNASFDINTAKLDSQSIRCKDGIDSGDTCLSDPQIATIVKINAPTKFGFSLASGPSEFPGYNALTSDAGIAKQAPQQPIVSVMGFGFMPPGKDYVPGMQQSASMTSDFFRYAVTRDPAFNTLTFDIKNGGKWARRLSEISKLDLQDQDLSGFAARGGKALLMHGLSDMLVTPRGTENYYNGLRTRMGGKNVDSFMRFYTVPGFGHYISTAFNVGWDQLTALENWVEKGVDPAKNQVIADTIGVPGRTRPLCLYPTWPKYNGAGDIDAAASFTCVK